VSAPSSPAVPGSRRTTAVTLAVLALGLAVWTGFLAADATNAADVVQGLRIGLVAAWAIAGVVLALRWPDERFGLLVVAAATVGGIAAASDAALLDRSGSGLELVRALAVAALPAMALHVLLTLPTGAFVRRTHRNTVVVGYGLAIVAGLGIWSARPTVPLWIVFLQGAAVLVGSVMANARYRRSRGRERQRMQWFGLAVTTAAEIALVTVALRIFVGAPENVGAIAAGATATIPVGFVLSTSNRMLSRVDRLLAHTVSLTALTGVVVAVYIVIVLGLGRVPTDRESTILLLSMAAAAVAALLYSPARARLATFSNRLVYGEQHAPDEAMRTFGSRLSRAIPLDELLLQLAESLRKSLGLEQAEVWTGSGGVLERTISVPARGRARLTLSGKEQPVVARAGVSGPAWLSIWLPQLLEGREDAIVRAVPAAHSGELLGLLVVQRSPEADQFTADDESMLAELARQVGLALHNVELDSALQESLEELKLQAEELRASRARVVAAGDAERRRIERDLHDGAQQHLVALAVTVRLARQLADRDPDQAKNVLDQLGSDLQETVQEVRNLAHGIFPPLLMDQGLPAALEAAAARAALPTTVDAAGIGRRSQELEAAVYFCCLEALQNAGKHAGDGAHATIRLREEEGKLLFEVADDGPGFDLASRAVKGHGFVNMSDRIGAIGGTLTVDSASGEGTRISGSVPLDEG
jgi:signal transduction histidine kinase